MADADKPMEVPVAEHIEALSERTAATFALGAAHARMVDVILRRNPNDPTALVAAHATRNALTAALNLFNDLHAAQQQAGLLVAERERAEHQGQVQ